MIKSFILEWSGGSGWFIGWSIAENQVAFWTWSNLIGGSDNFQWINSTSDLDISDGARPILTLNTSIEVYGFARWHGWGTANGMVFYNQEPGFESEKNQIIILGGWSTRWIYDGNSGKYRWGDQDITLWGTQYYIDDAIKQSGSRGIISSTESTVFSWSGLNDITISWTYTGWGEPTFRVTITDTDNQLIAIDITAGTFNVWDSVVWEDMWSTGTVMSTFDDVFFLLIKVISGDFSTESRIDNLTVSGTANVLSCSDLSDVATFSNGIDDPVINNLIDTPATLAWVSYTALSSTWHLIGDEWTADITSTLILWLQLDYLNKSFKLGGIKSSVIAREVGRFLDFNGNLRGETIITPPWTRGDQTINTTMGRVRFSAGETDLTVTNNLVTPDTQIFFSLERNDVMTSVSYEPGSWSFIIYPDFSPDHETFVDFIVINAVP